MINHLSDEIKLALSKWGYNVGQVNDFENITNEVLDVIQN